MICFARVVCKMIGLEVSSFSCVRYCNGLKSAPNVRDFQMLRNGLSVSSTQWARVFSISDASPKVSLHNFKVLATCTRFENVQSPPSPMASHEFDLMEPARIILKRFRCREATFGRKLSRLDRATTKRPNQKTSVFTLMMTGIAFLRFCFEVCSSKSTLCKSFHLSVVSGPQALLIVVMDLRRELLPNSEIR